MLLASVNNKEALHWLREAYALSLYIVIAASYRALLYMQAINVLKKDIIYISNPTVGFLTPGHEGVNKKGRLIKNRPFSRHVKFRQS